MDIVAKPRFSADSATNGLYVEPGGYSPWIARSSIGFRGDSNRWLRASDDPLTKTSGSNVGYDASALIAPVVGSITTTAPPVARRFFAVAESVTPCA